MASHIASVVARVAPAQYGLITRVQLLEAGVPERTIDNHIAVGRLDRVHAGVYGVSGTPHSWLRRVLAATFATGGVAAGRAAGAIWDLLPMVEVPIEIVVPITANPDPDGFVVHRTRRPFEVCIARGIPITSVARTLDDLGRVLPARTLEELVDQALHRRLVRIDDLVRSRGLVRRFALERSGAAVESVLETRFRRIIRDAGLPIPVAQYEIRQGGVVVGRVDFAYPAERLAIELDGYRYHSGRQAFDRGHRRQIDIQSAGYLVVPFTSSDLRSPKRVTSTVRRFLYERGHPDVVQL